MNRIVLHIENDYDYANVANINNSSTFSFNERIHKNLEFILQWEKEVEEEMNIIRTRTKIR